MNIIADQKINDLHTGIKAAEKDIESANALFDRADKAGSEAAKRAAALAKESAGEAIMKYQQALGVPVGSAEQETLKREGLDMLHQTEDFLSEAAYLLGDKE